MIGRIRTATAAKICGVSTGYLLEKMRTGEYDLGDYNKNGKKAYAVIRPGKLAAHLQRSKQYTQKDIDDAVKKRLAREKRKWQREQQKAGDGAAKEDKGQEDGESEADQKAKKAEEKAAALEMKWTCLEHEVKKDCVDDVLALAKVHMAKDEGMDIEDAIDEVLKKYPQFKDGYEDSDEENGQDKKGWGQRHGKAQPKSTTVEDEIRKQLFGK
ncbi:hypothetical protein [Hungatella hathewayi]|uniref:hypothetical protein n=1 Tax=Hungatella hathewayi TaxID=154046 RepID=UPI0032198C5F